MHQWVNRYKSKKKKLFPSQKNPRKIYKIIPATWILHNSGLFEQSERISRVQRMSAIIDLFIQARTSLKIELFDSNYRKFKRFRYDKNQKRFAEFWEKNWRIEFRSCRKTCRYCFYGWKTQSTSIERGLN